MPKPRTFDVANMSFNAIRENKILAKISEFTLSRTKQKPTNPIVLRLNHEVRTAKRIC